MASVIPDSDFRLLFDLSPTLYLVLLPDAPRFTIAGVSNSYLAATLTERSQILGRGVFEVFPDNPSDAAATGVSNLKASLECVVATGRADTMAVQKYDIRKPESEGSEFEERYWSPVNSPVSSNGTLLYILHRVEDVTDFVRAKEKGVAQAEFTEHLRIRNEQIESEIFVRAQQLQESNRQLRLANHDLALLREQESARAREDLARSERRYRTLVSATTSIVWTRSPGGAFDEPQPSWAAFTGQAFEEYCGWGWLIAIHPEDRARVETHWRAALRGEEYPDIEARIFHAATRKYHYFVERAVPVRDPNGVVEEWIGTVTEIEGRRRLEEQLRHTAKLESLGILAGGIAHDFNNLLTGVLGNSSQALEVLLLRNAGERALIENVMSAAERAAHLTRQMLAYAGKGTFALTNVNLSELVRGMSALVQTSVPKSVHLQLNLQDNLPLIEGDVGQLQQVVMNLIINGAEAIPPDRPGTVLATTSVQDVDEQYAANFSPGAALTPGRYVVLEVHDNGAGMSEETRERIFDPFFTTKTHGRGLGLSAVLGIVRSLHGALRIYSNVGKGTTFKILFPAKAGEQIPEQEQPAPSVSRGDETILIVDDEEVIRSAIRAALEWQGYQVLSAENGARGVEIFRERRNEIAVVITDLTMPGMGGEEVLRRIRAIRPEIPAILSSGYNESLATQQFAGKGLSSFLQKPFSFKQLISAVAQAIGTQP